MSADWVVPSLLSSRFFLLPNGPDPSSKAVQSEHFRWLLSIQLNYLARESSIHFIVIWGGKCRLPFSRYIHKIVFPYRYVANIDPWRNNLSKCKLGIVRSPSPSNWMAGGNQCLLPLLGGGGWLIRAVHRGRPCFHYANAICCHDWPSAYLGYVETIHGSFKRECRWWNKTSAALTITLIRIVPSKPIDDAGSWGDMKRQGVRDLRRGRWGSTTGTICNIHHSQSYLYNTIIE